MAYLHPQVQHRARDWEVKRVAQYLSPDKGCMAGLCFGEGIHWKKKQNQPYIHTSTNVIFQVQTRQKLALEVSVRGLLNLQ